MGRLTDDAGRVRVTGLHGFRRRSRPLTKVGVSDAIGHFVLLGQDQAVTDAVTENGAFCGDGTIRHQNYKHSGIQGLNYIIKCLAV